MSIAPLHYLHAGVVYLLLKLFIEYCHLLGLRLLCKSQADKLNAR